MAGYHSWSALFNIVVISTLLAVTAVYGSVQWKEEQELTVKHGDNINITCTVKVNDIFEVVTIKKKDHHGDLHDISQSKSVQEPFKATGRYRVESNKDLQKNEIKIILHISGITGADGGEIGCAKTSDPANVAFVKVNVHEPIEEVYFLRNGEALTEQVIHMVQGNPGAIACVADTRGSDPDATTMKILIGGKDVTATFQKTVEPDVMGHVALPEGGAEVTLKREVSDPPSEWHNKEIECQAVAAGYPDPETTRARIEVKYGPEIKCEKYKYRAELGSSVQIKCTVRAHPVPDITWRRGQDQGGTESEKSFTSSEKKIQKGEWESICTINPVSASHFTQFHIQAKNEVDSQEVTVTLEEVGGGYSPIEGEDKQDPKDEPVEIETKSPPEIVKTKPDADAVNPKVGESKGDGPTDTATSCVSSVVVLIVAFILAITSRS